MVSGQLSESVGQWPGVSDRGQGGKYLFWGYAGKLLILNGLREERAEKPARRRLFRISLAPRAYLWRSLAQKIPMRTIKDMTIETRKVVLDETEFIRCCIRHCEIHYSGGIHSLVDTKIEGCTWVLHDAAQRTASLINRFSLSRLAPDAAVLSRKPQ